MTILGSLFLALNSFGPPPALAGHAWNAGNTGPAPLSQDATFEERADLWLARHGVEAHEAGDMETIIEVAFVRMRLGLFDVRVPAQALEDRGWLEVVQECAQTLVDVQMEWIAWVPPREGEAVPAELKAHAKTLEKWIKGWKRERAFSRSKDTRGKDVLDVTEAKEKTREAAAFFADYMASGATLGPFEEALPPAQIVLLPERTDFVEFSAVVGRLIAELRPKLWLSGAATWTYFRFHESQALALQFATPDGERDYTQSIPMTHKNEDGLNEHVAQLASRSLLDRLFQYRMDPMISAGLANNLVIALFDEVDTRTDGDTRSRSVAGRSAFVSGAASDGGLMAADASSRWREFKGSDHFVSVLRKAQKAGSKDAKEKWQKAAGFELRDDNQSQTFVLLAPVLGASSSGPPPPAEFQGDYAEFLRAYRSAFLHWLREQSAGKESNDRFGNLMRMMADGEVDLAEQFSTAYGMPLAAAGEGLENSLEGQFVAWLAKQ